MIDYKIHMPKFCSPIRPAMVSSYMREISRDGTKSNNQSIIKVELSVL